MRMDFKKIIGAISERRGAVGAAALGAAALGVLAWALSTGPLTPAGAGAGSTRAMGSGPSAAMGSASAPAPADGGRTGEEAAGAEGTPEAPAQPDAGDDGKGGGSASGQTAPGQGTAKSSKPTSGGSSGGASQGGGQAQAPSTGGGQAQKPSKPKPSHTHSWQAVYRTEPVYEQQWVSKWEDVYTRHERYRCTTCGATYYSLGEMNAHLDSTIDWDEMTGHAGYLDDSYTTVEKVDNGSYQSVQTGTRQVLDHYECACGATK